MNKILKYLLIFCFLLPLNLIADVQLNLKDNHKKWCTLTKEQSKVNEKWAKVMKKRDKFFHTCILDHSKKGSSVPFNQIEESCDYLAKDKHEGPKETEFAYIHKTTKEKFTFENYEYGCHEH